MNFVLRTCKSFVYSCFFYHVWLSDDVYWIIELLIVIEILKNAKLCVNVAFCYASCLLIISCFQASWLMVNGT